MDPDWDLTQVVAWIIYRNAELSVRFSERAEAEEKLDWARPELDDGELFKIAFDGKPDEGYLEIRLPDEDTLEVHSPKRLS